MKHLKDKKVFLFSTLILSFITSLNSVSIYYEKPSSARLAAPSHTPPACTYQNKKYTHGQQVTTPEPCLNCTCRKGVLLCFLRVCPTLIQTASNDNCRTVREPGQCCPVLKCETFTTADTFATTPIMSTTKSLSQISQTEDDSRSLSLNLLNAGKTLSDSELTDNDVNQSKDNISMLYIPEMSKFPKPIEKSVNSRLESRVTVTQKDFTTTIFQTSPSTTFHDSVLMVTSSPSSILEEDTQSLINTVEGSCHLNGTVYAEGSAVISTSFCEYCYCIKSKRMCIRPRCHLSILGCLPRYTSEYACCPTSYVCGDEALTTLPMSTTTTSSTTTTTTESARILGRRTVCLIDGTEYKVGDPIPSDQHCKQCYCSTGGIKKCKSIQCSPEMDGCVPVIPEGYCCPIEYKCNSSLQTTKDDMNIESIQTTQKNIDFEETTTDLSDEVMDKISIQITTKTSFDETVVTTSANNFNLSLDSEELFTTETTLSETQTIKSDINVNQTENSQQIRSDDSMVTNDTNVFESLDNSREQLTTETEVLLNATTNELIAENEILNKTSFKSESHLKDIEFNAQTNSTVSSDVNSDTTPFVTQSSTTIEIIAEDSTIKSNNSTEVLNSSENNSTKQSENETIYESVGGFLQGIIHAIDKQLQRRIPAEPRLKTNTSEEVVENKEINDTQTKPLSSRSETKVVQPSLSSSFFITDNNEQPYKDGPEGVEIITAKTAFYDIDDTPGHSILINLSPNSLKVSSPPLESNPQKNDKNFDILAQNNRATVYGKPLQPVNTYTQYMNPSNDWRVVGSQFPRRPVFEEPSMQSRPVDSLYYNDNRRHDSEETIDQNVTDVDKRPRLEFENPNDRMKVIPFKVNDAVGGLPQKKKNGSFLIRLAPNKNSLTPDSTPKPTQQISCFFNQLEYLNGAMIPKPDPCTLCRCFYGRELCQQQKCPGPPEKDCIPEKMMGYCCPRYICRVIEDPKVTPKPSSMDPMKDLTSNSSPVRTVPQFFTEVSNLKNTSIENSFPQNIETNKEDNNEKHIQVMPDLSAMFPHNHNHNHNHPPLPPMEATPKPFQRISSFNKKQSENRIHFPTDSESIVSVISQPILTDSLSSLIPNSGPTKPKISSSGFPHYNSANKFRIKPSPIITQSIPSQSMPFGSPQNPNLRLPPFLLHSHSSPNTFSPNGVRHKISTSSSSGSHSEHSIPIKSETILKNISNESNNKTLFISNESMDERNNKTIASITSSIDSNHSLTTTVRPTLNISLEQRVTTTRPQSIDKSITKIMSTTTTTTTTTPTPKSLLTVDENSSKTQNAWDLFRVSGCNIYGTMYKIDAQIDRLNTECKSCVCSAHGVKCTEIC